MFADLSGYTELCRRLDPEDVELTVEPLMAALRTAAHDEGGVIVNSAGDGFFSIFGVPTSQADAPLRAVRAGRAMRRIVETRNREPGLTRVPDVHIGIAAGEVLVSPSDEPSGWSLIGAAINLASRLCDIAEAGEILVDAACRQLVSREVIWEAKPGLTLRGHDVPVDAWRAVEAPVEPSTAEVEIPFVGREQLLGRLDDELNDVRANGLSRVLHIAGHAGTGKSRLVSHWLTATSGVRSVWLWCGASVVGQPILRLVDLIVDLIGESPPDMAALLSARSASARQPYGADPLPVLGNAVRRLLGQATREQPLVVVIDDLHVADDALVDLVNDLRADPPGAAALLVCTWRQEEAGTIEPVDIEMTPLATPEIERLVNASLGASPPPRVLDAIVSRVEGHPLMALQSAAYLVESGVVTVDGGECRLAEPESVETLPTSLRLFVAARVDQLGAREKSLLQEISTLGDDITDYMLNSLVTSLDGESLASLQARGLLRRSEDGRWQFAHGLIQEVTYSTLTRRTRSELHKRHLDRLGPDAPSELRAYHAQSWAASVSGGNPGELSLASTAALRETLTHSQELFATEARSAHTAIHHIRGLVDEWRHKLPEVSAQLLTLDAQCLLELGQFEDSLRAATIAETTLLETNTRSEVWLDTLLVKGHALSRLRRYLTARQALDDAMALAEATGNASAKAHALRLMADTWRHTVFSRYVALTEDAFHAYEAAGDSIGAGECARILAYLYSPSSPRNYRRWFDLAQASTDAKDYRGQAHLARAATAALGAQLAYPAAEGFALRAIEFGERTGLVDAVADGLASRIECAVAQGDISTALETAERLIELAVTVSNPRMRLSAGAIAAAAFLRSGDSTRAEEELAAARKELAEFGTSELAEVSLAEAAIGRDLGRWDSALAAYAETQQADLEGGFTLFSLNSRLQIARIHVVTQPEVGTAEAAAVAVEATELGAPLVASLAAAIADLASVVSGDPTPRSGPNPEAGLEELAIRADTEAIRAELVGSDSTALWSSARDCWQRLGYTVWLARAQARAGDEDAAAKTLQIIGAPDEARSWALGA
jgi:class 3 adenylate cyclase/tetratricopeptide (TPR) repeat protein